MWFQNRRAKYRKQEKQLAKSLSPVIPTCNGMMRNIYPTNTRPYAYPSPANVNMNTMTRYPQMNSGYSPAMAQFSSMGSMPSSNMASMTMPRQVQQFPMATDYNLVSQMVSTTVLSVCLYCFAKAFWIEFRLSLPNVKLAVFYVLSF